MIGFPFFCKTRKWLVNSPLAEFKDKISNVILEWLQKQNYRITKIDESTYFVREGKTKAGKGFLLEMMDLGGRGKWGDIEL